MTGGGRLMPAAPGSQVRFGDGALVACDNLVRIYKVADLEVVALQGLDLLVQPGEMIAIVGASGSGKSTLMNILGGLDVPTAGNATVAGHNLSRMNDQERTRYRRRVVGFVWQQTARNLLPYLTAAENVALPMALDGRSDRAASARSLLDLVGVAELADLRPERLSGGQQQRVAIAVALANNPAVMLADEPTGELDTKTAAEIFAVLRRANAASGTTVVIVTHDAQVAEQVGRTVLIRDGRTSSETVRRTERDGEGEHRVIAEEFAVLDRAGRLQLPKSHVEALHLERRVRLRLEPDHVGVWPTRPVGHREPVAARPAEPLAWSDPGSEGQPAAARDTQLPAGPILEAVGLSRDYPSGSTVVRALRGVDLAVNRHELVAVRGRSGSGKTTLLNLLGGLDRPTSGRVLVDGHDLSAMSEDQLVDVRRTTIAFVFQTFGLIPILSAAENVEVPLRLVGLDPAERERRVELLLRLVRLDDRARHRPYELSGGEQQRVAIARALANRPHILLADEPTAQLDSETGHAVMTLLRSVVDHEGITAVVATHDPVMLDVADRVIELRDGVAHSA